MSEDVLLDFGGMHSPHSTSSDDSDAVNTESARVYFGPLQSPERKYAGLQFDTPVKRLVDPSSAPDTTPERLEEEIQPAMESGESEPLPTNDDPLPDEPSIALVSKILQAHSNPSPPPSLPPVQAELDLLVDVFDSPANGATMLLSHSPPHIEEQMNPYADISQPDLIVFDTSFSAVSALPRQNQPSLPVHSTSPSTRDLAPHATNVDDLLSISPQPVQTVPLRDVEPDDAAPSAAGESRSSVGEEVQMADIIDFNVVSISPEPLQNPPIPEPDVEPVVASVPSMEEEAQVADAIKGGSVELEKPGPILEQPAEPQPEPRTPVRRSTRPQQSITPDKASLLTSDRVAGMDQAGPFNTPLLLTTPVALRIKKKNQTGDALPGVDVNVVKASEEQAPTVLSSPERNTRAVQLSKAHHELGSSSRAPAGLLDQLLPTALQARDQRADHTVIEDQALMSELTRPTSMPPNPRTPPRASALDIHHPPSAPPSTPPRPADLNRTPARRVPISQAVAQGTFSPRKRPLRFSKSSDFDVDVSASGGATSTPVFRRPDLNDPNRSPAKRVPVLRARPQHEQPVGRRELPHVSQNKGKAPFRPASPLGASFKDRARSCSVEPRPSATVRVRSGSAEPLRPQTLAALARRDGLVATSSVLVPDNGQTGSSSQERKARAVLPFPVVASSGRIPPTVPEEDEDPDLQPQKPQANLRQPSAGAGSKIPRPGVKPYARPKLTPPGIQTKPRITPRRATGASTAKTASSMGPHALHSQRVVQVGSSSSSEEDNPRTAPRTPERPASRSLTNAASMENPVLNSLKRKRDGPSVASPPGAQPIVLIDKVVPRMLSQSRKAGTNSTLGASKQAHHKQTGIQKPQAPIMMRKVPDWKRPVATKSPANDGNSKPSENHSPTESIADEHSSARPARVGMLHGPSDEVSRSGALLHGNATHSPPSAIDEDISPSDRRRSSRSRRTSADAKSDVAAPGTAAVRSRAPRRKPTIPAEPAAFVGMSALALKTLTGLNTKKNEQHVAIIQTEVVRKEGKRPESPTTKVRTTLERQKQLKAQERRERAQRRALRLSGDGGSAETVPHEESDINGSSAIDVDEDDIPSKHRRGPGDEEDYVTPPRAEHQSKRQKLEDVIEPKEDKRVKWDRGLAKTVYLDDSPLKPRKPKVDVTRRGCLAQTAKTMRLDILGNVLDADTPLPTLVREEIIIKKFVYDDDEEAELLETDNAASSSTSTAKPSKTRSKKSKS
ncbi:uncharacterized protein LAESUDRAFT_720592 [Laetiporus sulphureus 93-53]|uniref:Uncharacterized protein n=1 Tax=Laetiporus sulphureus 93-53 TaxID=1314785 RepID=A0A165H7V9_9APHY|nr:uncharacterized protein LAESUDRAFT_720592 [Laetiporus sulphureus 93-53]KZT11367.1 hypothetical protein LAESUDRAFT_720592 [Laetiporus sulphureus 93-53]